MKKKKIIVIAAAVIVVIALIVIISKLSAKNANSNLFSEASFGKFNVIVTTTGELEAERSVDITGPSLMNSRRMRMSNFEITDMVDEGTEVKKGDYVASLDRTSFENTLKEAEESLEDLRTQLQVTILDTAVTLSGLRNDIVNYEYSVEEAKITLQQSTYESSATIREAEIALDKAERQLAQALNSYSLSEAQANSDMREAEQDVTEQEEYVQDLIVVLSQFEVTAPADGMVIYKKDRQGSKITIGSSISPYQNVVATLPDMSQLQSKTYVNEVDINKVKVGQTVEIVIDAFPDKTYTGKVTSVANIGEQLPNADAKVFEVIVRVDQSDAILKPGMTTSNKIMTNSFDEVIFVPIESVQTGTDSIPFIYMKDGTKRIVLEGTANENFIIIEEGIAMGESFYLNTPENADKFTRIKGEELIEKIRAKALEEEAAQQAAQEAAQQRGGNGGGGMRGGAGRPAGEGGGFPGGGGGFPAGGFPGGGAPQIGG